LIYHYNNSHGEAHALAEEKVYLNFHPTDLSILKINASHSKKQNEKSPTKFGRASLIVMNRF
jgi:hypothetical protein